MSIFIIFIFCNQDEKVDFKYQEGVVQKPSNYMDRWVISFTQSLIKFVHEEMKGLPQLHHFCNDNDIDIDFYSNDLPNVNLFYCTIEQLIDCIPWSLGF